MKKVLCVVLCLFMLLQLTGCVIEEYTQSTEAVAQDSIPAFSGEPYVAVNDNKPNFSEADLDTDAYEYYS